MKKVLLLLLLAATCPTHARHEFLYERIGSNATNSVPVEIQMATANKQYHLRFVGKDDCVAARVTRDGKSLNIRLTAEDLDALASIKGTAGQTNSPISLRVKLTRQSDWKSTQLYREDVAVKLLLQTVHIFELPEYEVVSGDTFSGILKHKLEGQYTRDEIMAVNPGLFPNFIHPKQIIKLPREPK